MRADRLHVAVRPRGILECLDLAVMFCGRRPLAVATAIAIGAAPFILINRLLFGGPADQPMLIPAIYVLGIEAAWASVPLTLYLGQAVFAERFSWRMATRSLVGSLPALVLYQGLLRGICIVMLFLVPVVLVAMYYLNQVILLERPKLSRIWSRRGAINQRISGHILSLVVVDAVLLAVGVPVLTGLLGGISSVWQGRPITWLPGNADTSFIPSLFSWHGQIAFWSVCGLLTVFRFFTYLDARIRREGWDVELKLRSPATYAGIPEPTTSRMIGAAGWLLAFLLASVGGSATAATGEAGHGAKRALSRQSFPWYDAPRDSFRSLIQPDQEARPSESASSRQPPGTRTSRRGDTASRFGPGQGSGRGTGSGSGRGASPPPIRIPWSFSFPNFNLAGLGKVLMIGLFIAAALVIIYLVVRHGLPFRKRSDTSGDDGAADDADEERLAALPDGARLSGSDLLTRASACADEGNFARAMIFFFAWQLLELDRRGGLTLSRGKTNGQYVTEVTRAAPAIAGLFHRSSRLFEDAFFGDLPVPQADFQSVWNERNRIASFIRPLDDDSASAGNRSRSRTAARAMFLALAAAMTMSTGCQRTVETEYAAVRGGSINGVTAFVQLLRDTGHAVTARQYLPDTIASDVVTVVVFDDSFTRLSPAAEEVLSPFVNASGSRTLLLVLRDSDCIPEYLRTLLADEELSPDRREMAEGMLADAETSLQSLTSEKRSATPPFPDGLVITPRSSAAEAIDVRARQRKGSTERQIQARWELRRRLEPGMTARTLWSAGRERLLIRHQKGATTIFVLASAAPILNGGFVDPGNRLLAEDLAGLLPTEGKLLVVGSAAVADGGGSDDDETESPSPWRLLAVQPLPWVAAQSLVAMALFCWCTSPIFGRAKRSSPTHSQDFGHHVAALASLVAKAPAAGRTFARVRLEAWRAVVTPTASKHRRRPRS